VSIDVTIIGSNTQDLDELVRAAGMPTTTRYSIESLKPGAADATPSSVIVLDLREQGTLPSLAQFRKDHPAAGLVIVAATLDPSLMRDAMRAGVRECVVEPVTQVELTAAIQRVAGPAKVPQAAEVFAMVGAKGGVGVTTLAVNVATALAAKARGEVLLIDLHPACGDAALFLGAEPRFTMLDALENIHRLDETYLKGLVTKTKSGPDLLASPDRMVGVTADAPRVRAVVDAAARCYRYVVLDVPRSEPSAADALGLASSITVVATQDVAALRNANRLITLLRQRYGQDSVRVAVNRFDQSGDIGEKDLERALGGPIRATFPEFHRLAVGALNKGLPIVVENHNKLASALTTYARTLMANAQPDSPSTKSAGFLSKLTGRR
jgi:pilus assembly protein CpaE